MKRSKLWSGLTSTSAALLVVGLIGQNLAAANASYINTALGTTTTKVVQTGEVGDRRDTDGDRCMHRAEAEQNNHAQRQQQAGN